MQDILELWFYAYDTYGIVTGGYRIMHDHGFLGSF